jgi:hypothetical protein
VTGEELLFELSLMTKKELSKKVVVVDEPSFGPDEYIEIQDLEIKTTEKEVFIVLQ